MTQISSSAQGFNGKSTHLVSMEKNQESSRQFGCGWIEQSKELQIYSNKRVNRIWNWIGNGWGCNWFESVLLCFIEIEWIQHERKHSIWIYLYIKIDSVLTAQPDREYECECECVRQHGDKVFKKICKYSMKACLCSFDFNKIHKSGT